LPCLLFANNYCAQQSILDANTLQDWADAPDMASASQEGKAILIFMPGAPEIARLVRLLESSSRLRQAGQGRCKVLSLHGALPSHAQVLLAVVTS
jgi:HrpA-like RNA helicase